MRQILILFFCVFLVSAVEGAAKSCLAKPKARKCLEVFKSLGEQASDYDLTNPNSSIPTNELCGKFKRCAPTFSCDPEPKLVYAVNITILFCDAIDYFTNEFETCQVALDSNITDCTRAWAPFPEDIEDKKLKEEMQKEACKNYFGKDNCMKDEIIKTCGVEQWYGFRKAHLALNTIIGACQFKEGEP